MTSISQFSQPAVRFGTIILDPEKKQMTVKLDKNRTHVKVGREVFTPRKTSELDIYGDQLIYLHNKIQQFVDNNFKEELEHIMNVEVLTIVHAMRQAGVLPPLTEQEINAFKKEKKLAGRQDGKKIVFEEPPRVQYGYVELTNPVWDKTSKCKSLTFDYNC
ncbi:MAG: hypothetical protein QE263_06070 [Vampirovibrionales bacterium]|nr:hypothetical protein [Vampirovibrionales bacterium]